MLLLALAGWVACFSVLAPFADWVTYRLLRYPQLTHTSSGWFCQNCQASIIDLTPAMKLGETIHYFLYDTPKVLLLLTLVVFVMGVVRSFFTTEGTRRALAGRRELTGNISAAGLGAVVPFCTCSAVPLFIGFVSAGVPLGVTFSFLISSPLVNEVALALLLAAYGWRVAGIYLATGLIIAVAAGWIIGRSRMERHIEPWVVQTTLKPGEPAPTPDWAARFEAGTQAMREIVGRVWPFILVGIAVAAVMHGYLTEDALAGWLGNGAWWGVPLAVIIGIPLYGNAAGFIPVLSELTAHGASLGSALAFMMSVVGLSLPELIILRRILRLPLIITFVGVVTIGILVTGYLFNFLIK